ncbi:MAG: YggS family pyridoxal phosphate-dependent enzyme [Bacilli bacterium]|nr:YggS family pyridoxal phosphate-dependent enzyme [Bacilli bacterium]MBR6137421.1 YggS family pyridoxal phosphate-dependent enzyme [Bacilli bacterium]
MIKENILRINDEIKDYNAKLICVSKTRTNYEIMEAYNVGVRDFGENHVQELIEKRKSLPKDINWHMIGHLQTNKVKDLLKDKVFLIHSVDSIKLASEIDKRTITKQDILLEVNIAKEESKYGFIPEYNVIKDALDKINKMNNINCIGLMCVAPNTNNPEENIKYFNKLKELANKFSLDVLSMGMTNDYLYAVKCGSTYIRVGTGIFGPRDYTK